MNTTTTMCANGTLKAGDLVISTPEDEYSCLVGRVLRINLSGTSEHDEETANETDDVHVNFLAFDYPEERLSEIEKMFSELYCEEKYFDDCPLDDVIMAPGSLIRITGIDEVQLCLLLQSGGFAASFCKEVLREHGHQTDGTSAEDFVIHILELIESAVLMAGYDVLEGDTGRLYIKRRQSDTGFVIKVDNLPE